jgi:predicted nuclease of predicted toxin-antitoxin system
MTEVFNFLIDAQLPPALRTWLEAKGHHALHVTNWRSGEVPDPDIATYCASENRVLISKDEDFLRLQAGLNFAFVWLRIGNATNSNLFNWLEPRWTQIEKLLVQNECLIEVK